ncbi:MAG TPA: HD domain-containing protein [Candidatus Thermoplasmatota archaeon]|nr:HD domain-containing protein [Candidatus Thermoplasmatota archaeon]
MSWSAQIRARVAPLYEQMVPYDPCHDLFHVERVVRNARLLARLEGADEEVCAAAAYLHDLDRTGSKDALADARAHLVATAAPADWSARVMEAVERHKDKSFAPGGKKAMSIEAAVVGDADKLEAIGAIGIARAFSFGGLKGRALWDGADTTPADVYVSGRMGTTIQHFYDKLLRLQDDFNTASGRRLGAERTMFLRTYLERFFAEWRAASP